MYIVESENKGVFEKRSYSEVIEELVKKEFSQIVLLNGSDCIKIDSKNIANKKFDDIRGLKGVSEITKKEHMIIFDGEFCKTLYMVKIKR